MQKSPLIYSDSADRRSLAASHDEQRGKLRSRDSSSGDQSRNLEAKSTKVSKRRSVQVPSSSSEMEEGELEPDPETEAEQPSLTTKSDGFGTFVSFASSQPFVHDPRCSLTQNSSKVEDHLIGSRFAFGSVDSVPSDATCQAHTSKNSMKNGSDPPFQSVLLKQFVLNGISCLNQEHLQSFPSEKACIPGRNTGLISGRDFEKKPVFDELERVIKFKQAEAKMYQERADSARKEALDLRHIATEKSSKMDEDYASRIEKSRLVQLEERRGEKLKELQSMEMAHREYCNMKCGWMEVGIKDLLLKMEATRRNLNSC
ncbi:uncharacterized protein LOC141814200 [Curcuma longa]|uniref:uncharacterized protein LOC141814200 n=1 Tax=Curcuma longa TaxID=136217 RepID=UPI003D9E3C4F